MNKIGHEKKYLNLFPFPFSAFDAFDHEKKGAITTETTG
jgi:hypothetical protein